MKSSDGAPREPRVAPPPVIERHNSTKKTLQPALVGPAPPLAEAPFDAAQAKAYQAAWARHLGTTVETVNSVGAKLAIIPPGEFLMGSTPEQNALSMKMAGDANLKPDSWDVQRLKEEMPHHRVVLSKPYLMGDTEVTIGQFKKFVDATNYVTEAEQYGFGNSAGKKMEDWVTPVMKKMTWCAPGYAVNDDSPVTQITWNDAVSFCNWLSDQEKLTPCYRQDAKDGWMLLTAANGYRLPTEAEWEYACRAGTTTQFWFGDDVAELEQREWYNKNAGGRARAVGLKLPNPFGLYDMHGNVREWCSDYYDVKWYEESPLNNPLGPTAVHARVIRGGYGRYHPFFCRSASRYLTTQSNRDDYDGFRYVRVLDGPAATPSADVPRSVPPSAANMDLDRQVAEMVLQKGPGGSVHLLLNGREIKTGKLAELPSDRFTLTGINVTTSFTAAELAKIAQLRSLGLLAFYFPSPVSDADLSHLTGPDNLIHLICQSPNVTDAGLAVLDRLPNLIRLNVVQTKIKGPGLKHLKSVSNLIELDIPAPEDPSYCASLKGLTLLTQLRCGGPQFTDDSLDHIKDLPKLDTLLLRGSTINDAGFDKIKQMHSLKHLELAYTKVTDAGLQSIAQLKQLERLDLSYTVVSDAGLEWLGPLKILSFLSLSGTRITDSGLERLKSMKTLLYLHLLSTNTTAVAIDRLRTALPACKIEWDESAKPITPQPAAPGKAITTFNDPAFKEWMKDVAALSADKQVDAVARKLQELNPGFDGKVTAPNKNAPPAIENGAVTGLGFDTDNVTDISPVRALASLKDLSCRGSAGGKGQLSDLSPLQGLSLRSLSFYSTQVSDVSPLKGMPLTYLDCSGTPVSDLLPLEGMKLTFLDCHITKVSDLSPLRGMPLSSLICGLTLVSDLSPLKAMPLMWLDCGNTLVADLSPLQGMRLKDLRFGATRVSDLSPLKGMKLTFLTCRNTQVSDLSPLQGMPLTTLECNSTQVSDLSPLKGLALENLYCNDTRASDLAPLQDCKNLKMLRITTTKVAPAGVAALQTALPACKIEWDPAPVPGGSATNVPPLPADRAAAQWAIASRGTVRLEINGAETPKITALGDLPPGDFRVRSIDLLGTPVRDAELDHLTSLQNLRQLNLGNTGTSDAGLVHLRDVHSLTFIDLGNTKITDAGLANLTGLPNLTTLGLLATQTTDAGLDPICKLVTLISLNLDHTKITNDGLSRLKTLQRLSFLNLDTVAVNDQGIAHLAKLENLHTLILVKTGLTDEGLTYLEGLKYLRDLNIKSTHVTPEGVAKFHAARQCCRVVRLQGHVHSSANRSKESQLTGRGRWRAELSAIVGRQLAVQAMLLLERAKHLFDLLGEQARAGEPLAELG